MRLLRLVRADLTGSAEHGVEGRTALRNERRTTMHRAWIYRLSLLAALLLAAGAGNKWGG